MSAFPFAQPSSSHLCFVSLATRRWSTRWVFALALDDTLVESTATFGHAKDIGGVGAVAIQTAMLLCCSAAEAAIGNGHARRRRVRRRFDRGRGHDVRRFRRFGRGHAEQRQKEEEEDRVDAVAELHGSRSGYGSIWWRVSVGWSGDLVFGKRLFLFL
jgi:hypothetical protein